MHINPYRNRSTVLTTIIVTLIGICITTITYSNNKASDLIVDKEIIHHKDRDISIFMQLIDRDPSDTTSRYNLVRRLKQLRDEKQVIQEEFIRLSLPHVLYVIDNFPASMDARLISRVYDKEEDLVAWKECRDHWIKRIANHEVVLINIVELYFVEDTEFALSVIDIGSRMFAGNPYWYAKLIEHHDRAARYSLQKSIENIAILDRQFATAPPETRALFERIGERFVKLSDLFDENQRDCNTLYPSSSIPWPSAQHVSGAINDRAAERAAMEQDHAKTICQ